jgi:hypothetical protein
VRLYWSIAFEQTLGGREQQVRRHVPSAYTGASRSRTPWASGRLSVSECDGY